MQINQVGKQRRLPPERSSGLTGPVLRLVVPLVLHSRLFVKRALPWTCGAHDQGQAGADVSAP